MDNLYIRILQMLVSFDSLGRPIDNKIVRRNTFQFGKELDEEIGINRNEFYEAVKRLHLNYLIDVTDLKEDNGTIAIRQEGIECIKAITKENNKL